MEYNENKLNNEIKKELIFNYKLMTVLCILMSIMSYGILFIQYIKSGDYINIILITILMLLSAILGFMFRNRDIF